MHRCQERRGADDKGVGCFASVRHCARRQQLWCGPVCISAPECLLERRTETTFSPPAVSSTSKGKRIATHAKASNAQSSGSESNGWVDVEGQGALQNPSCSRQYEPTIELAPRCRTTSRHRTVPLRPLTMTLTPTPNPSKQRLRFRLASCPVHRACSLRRSTSSLALSAHQALRKCRACSPRRSSFSPALSARPALRKRRRCVVSSMLAGFWCRTSHSPLRHGARARCA